MKRAYKSVSVERTAAGHAVLLDGRPLRTPGRKPLELTSRALAEAIAAEWREQGEEVRPASMPLTRLASTTLDLVAANRGRIVEEIAAYAETDLLCYRAETPPELAHRQHAVWQPLLDWAAARFDAALAVTIGVVPRAQASASLSALRRAVEAHDDFDLVALHAATTATGSLVLGLCLLEGRIDAAAAWEASLIDESFQSEKWGEDSEAAARREAVREDLLQAASFHRLSRS